MARKIKGNMSDFHERVLIAMYSATWGHSWEEGKYHYLKGRGVAFLLGGAWSTYRHKEMLRLEGFGAVRCLKKSNGRGEWFYALTNTGINRVEEMIAEARKGSFELSASRAEKTAKAQRTLFNLGSDENVD